MANVADVEISTVCDTPIEWNIPSPTPDIPIHIDTKAKEEFSNFGKDFQNPSDE